MLQLLRLPILRGPLRGLWWLPAAGGKLLRVLGGTYEPIQTALLRRHLEPGHTFYDLGAHHGYYTLLASMLVGPRGRVVAFEPSPVNARFLRRHLAVNGLRNAEVIQAAISDTEGTAAFAFGSGSGTGRLAGAGELRVRTTTLDLFAADGRRDPHVVKIDVEGGEDTVLAGAGEMLARARPTIFLSTHGPELRARCVRRLRELGYDIHPVDAHELDAAFELLCVPV